MNVGARVWVGAGLAVALSGCGSSEGQPSPTDGGASSRGGRSAGGTGGSGDVTRAGQSTGGAGNTGNTAHSGGTGATGGESAVASPIGLTFSWATFELRGEQKTPLTCFEIGAETIGISVSGGSLETTLNWYTSGNDFCEKGLYEDFRWEHGPGDYKLSVTLYAGSVLDDDRIALVSEQAALSIPPGTPHVTIPELQLLRIVMPYSWSIQKAGAPVGCDDVAAETVEIQLADITESHSLTVTWSELCSKSVSETDVAPGVWDLSATLKGSTGPIATWQAPQKLTFTKQSAAVPPKILFEIP